MQVIRLLRAPFLRQRKIQMQRTEVEDIPRFFVIPRFLLLTESRPTAAPQMHIVLSVKACTSAVAQNSDDRTCAGLQLANQFTSYIWHNQSRCRFSNLNPCRLISTY
jgi:hypothetical protein